VRKVERPARQCRGAVPADRYILCNVELIFTSASSESFQTLAGAVCNHDVRRELALTPSKSKANRSGKATLWFETIGDQVSTGMQSIYCNSIAVRRERSLI
jgi:hypothetical protein